MWTAVCVLFLQKMKQDNNITASLNTFTEIKHRLDVCLDKLQRYI